MNESRDGIEKPGHHEPTVIKSRAPHVVSFNEKTGKALRPSHIEASQETGQGAPHANARQPASGFVPGVLKESGQSAPHADAPPGNLTDKTPLQTEEILRSEVQTAPLALFHPEGETQPSPQVRPEQLSRETAAANTIVPEQSDQEEHSTILLAKNEPHPADPHLETIGAAISSSENIRAPAADEPSSHLLTAPPEKTSIIPPSGLETAKAVTGTQLENSGDERHPADPHLETIGAGISASENLRAPAADEPSSHLLTAPPEKTSIIPPSGLETAKAVTGTHLENSGDERHPADPLLKTIGEAISTSENLSVPPVETNSHVVTVPLDKTSITPPPALDATKAVTGSDSANGTVATESFASHRENEPSEGHIDLPIPDQLSPATLHSHPEAVSSVNSKIPPPDELIAEDNNAETKNTSASQHSPSIKMVTESTSAQGMAVGHSKPGAMHISLNTESIEKLAKAEQMSQELAKKLDALSKRVSIKKK
jgi:hypothetical protein